MNQTAIFNAFNVYAKGLDNARITLVTDLKAAGVTTLEEARPWAIKWACAKTGAKFNLSARGKVMLDSQHPKYEGAKTTLRDVLLAFEGKKRGGKKREGKKREGGSSGAADPVALLLKKYAALTAAQKRAFKAAI